MTDNIEAINARNYVLVKSADLPTGYSIHEKELRLYKMIDDNHEAQKIVNKLLAEGAEIFENIQTFYAKYPDLTIEERNRIAKQNWPTRNKDDSEK